MRCPPKVKLGNFLKCPTTIGSYVRGVGRKYAGRGRGKGGCSARRGGRNFFLQETRRGEGGRREARRDEVVGSVARSIRGSP
jgi:hypothetical protein